MCFILFFYFFPAHRDCYENNGLYSALQLETKFNFNKFLNATVVREQI